MYVATLSRYFTEYDIIIIMIIIIYCNSQIGGLAQPGLNPV